MPRLNGSLRLPRPAAGSAHRSAGRSAVFNVYFSVVNLWLSSHIWLFRLVSSQLNEARCLGSGSAPPSAAARCSPQQHVTLSLRVA
ncbi:hypothetical protein EYF80_042615 [Liparis tanakae]|uniref:Uncharacterized protein n=1 Tax=Liparis tanakae TaxID=230148 RepID=A0A4Z2G206_9TELE|nr:hypothetical protein EYF80_042615 [Liparis tanakae]